MTDLQRAKKAIYQLGRCQDVMFQTVVPMLRAMVEIIQDEGGEHDSH